MAADAILQGGRKIRRTAADLARFVIRRPTRRLDPSGLSFYRAAGRQRVDTGLFRADPRLAVLLAFGQSNLANEGDPAALCVPVAGVYNFNPFDGRCYVARDPLLGASADRSNVATRLGDLLIRRGAYDRVLLLPIAFGGSYMADWAPRGILHARLAVALRRLARAGVAVTHALWAQGEAEAAAAVPDGAAWAERFHAMVTALRMYGVTAPLYVAQSTVCDNTGNAVIRAAQRSVIDARAAIFAGPDTDTIGLDERWDRCHFAASGMEKAAELWFRALVAPHAVSSRPREAPPDR